MGKGRKRRSSGLGEEDSSKRAKSKSSEAVLESPRDGDLEPDEISFQLSQERARAMEILDSVLRSSGTSTSDNRTKSHVVTSDNDVSMQDLADSRLQDESISGVGEEEEASKEHDGKRGENNPEQTFYDVRRDLKELFNSSSENTFTFLQGDVGESQGAHTPENVGESQGIHTPENVKSSPTEVLPHKEVKDHVKYFFFHCDNDVLRNRMEENSFVRAQHQEELEAEWPGRRTSMKNCFRKRQKEVLKAGKRRYGTAQLH